MNINTSVAFGNFIQELASDLWKRVEKGEALYNSEWQDKTIEELKQERYEEFLDYLVYSMFIDYKVREGDNDSNPKQNLRR